MSYFLPYQERWINDEAPLKLYEKSRRIGITYATSYRAVRKCLREKPGSNFTQWVSSRDELTAKEFVTDYVKMWAREANAVAQITGEPEVVDEKHGITAFVVRFANGARICSLSSNPLAFAGKGGDVLIDEMDLHAGQAALYAMAFPCTTWGGQLEMVSAYDASGSEYTEFARLCREAKGDNPMRMSFHRTTVDDAIAEGFVEKINETLAKRGRPQWESREAFRESLRRGCISASAWESQYLCVPNQASGQQLIQPTDLAAAQRDVKILRLHIEGADELESRRDLFDPFFWARFFGRGRYALGWDIAATGDLSAICANRLSAGVSGKTVHELAALITMHNCPRITRQRAVVDAMMRATYDIAGAGDKSGLGLSDCTELEEAYRVGGADSRFVGVNFASAKLALGTLMQGAFEERRQLLPLDHPEIAADVAALRRDHTAATNRLTFTAAKNPLLPDSHADIGWALALAIYAGETNRATGAAWMEAATGDDPRRGVPGYDYPDNQDDL